LNDSSYELLLIINMVRVAAFATALLALVASASGAALVARAPAPLAFTKCNPNANYAITAHSIAMDPTPARFGRDVTLIATGDLSTTIYQGAKVKVDARVGPFVIPRELDICEESAKDGLPCPIAPANNISIKASTEMPEWPISNIPVELTANLYNADGSLLSCFKANIVVV
jgi:hypothetical protein